VADRTRPGEAGNELHFTRVFEAPRALVFRCMVEPDHLTHFWGPTGMHSPRERITVDARPGGVFEIVMVRDDGTGEHALRAVYDIVREPEELAWTEIDTGAQVHTEFIELAGDRTEVRIHQTRVPDAFMASEAQAGFTTSLDRFAAHLARLLVGDRNETTEVEGGAP
jgi:uncharacterized protein YndB with AHSA1/START domain